MNPKPAVSDRDQKNGVSPTPSGYRTSPDQETTGWPPGIPYIIGNEVCERFSFYGMNAILAAHLATLYVAQGLPQKIAEDSATAAMHLFKAGVYALPMIGAILAERLLGKYRTILYVSIIYCAGHAVLSVGESYLQGMFLGLALIAIGSGGIKSCVAANVGDQFGRGNWFRVRTVYQIFYFSVNFGSFFATLLIPFIQEKSGPFLIKHFPALGEHFTPRALGSSVAFGIPGVLMFLATVVFWMGRRKFVHVPPRPGGRVGLLDAVSSTLLFMSVGHFFFTPNLLKRTGMEEAFKWPALLAISGAFLAAGLYLFSQRQRLMQDDGFLAILLYAFQNRGKTTELSEDVEDSKLARSLFWGPAVRRFGLKAAEGPVAVFKIISVFFLVAIFWALFDQHHSSWVFQAGQMDLRLWGDHASFLGIPNYTLSKNQIPALNPMMVMLLIPALNWVYGRFDRMGIRTTPLRRITVGMLIAAASFAVVAAIQHVIDAKLQADAPRLAASTIGNLAMPSSSTGLVTTSAYAFGSPDKVWFAWQIIAYLLLTVSEVMVSITGLEFAYTQAPVRMKSTIMGIWLLVISLGNVLVAFMAGFKDLSRVNFFWTFAALSAAAGLLFGVRAYFYVQKDYPQE
jgi:POT family proton-dependent oligopeptide transporter